MPINTFTTIITFLMIAVQENSSRRGAKATNKKLDAVLCMLEELEETTSKTGEQAEGIEKDTGVKD